jgi:predicted nucleotidyltransferase
MLEGNKNITPEIAHELELIKNAILAHTPAEAIYLFGSYAYGTPTRDSDLDICAVIPDSDVDIFDLRGNIRNALYKRVTLPIDLVLRPKSQFVKHINEFTIEGEVTSKGVNLYGHI